MICSSVNRLGFMSIPLRGDGLYPFLEEIAGLRSLETRRAFQPLITIARTGLRPTFLRDAVDGVF
jgi:hypothetical protein